MKLSIVSASVLLAAMSVSAYAYTPGTYTAAIAGQNPVFSNDLVVNLI